MDVKLLIAKALGLGSRLNAAYEQRSDETPDQVNAEIEALTDSVPFVGSLDEYVKVNFGNNKGAFAATQGVKAPQVTQWRNKKFIVVGDTLYSPRRELLK